MIKNTVFSDLPHKGLYRKLFSNKEGNIDRLTNLPNPPKIGINKN